MCLALCAKCNTFALPADGPAQTARGAKSTAIFAGSPRRGPGETTSSSSSERSEAKRSPVGHHGSPRRASFTASAVRRKAVQKGCSSFEMRWEQGSLLRRCFGLLWADKSAPVHLYVRAQQVTVHNRAAAGWRWAEKAFTLHTSSPAIPYPTKNCECQVTSCLHITKHPAGMALEVTADMDRQRQAE
ncbi:unnamed protein product [Prorocentrum cordatum]|uniref:Uncharacterized protein n=1 Tax=Prorocentrum cordatum TaxID=2364126 RepID=A0ABN9WRY6_9DINO|nr:unnamed protein product [Polarella glacialis]